MSKSTITIAGRSFNVPEPYEAGDTILSAGEASALNQVLHENVRNNLAKKITAELVPDLAAAQAQVDAYINDYEFGVRTGGGGGSRDPVQSELMAIAREAVKRGLQKAGHKVTGKEAVPSSQITDLAKQAIEKHPEWKAIAEKRVAEQKAIIDSM